LVTKLRTLEQKYPLKHPYAKLSVATKVLVLTISALDARMTANTYLVKKIAMMTKNGVQLPGMKNDPLAWTNLILSSRKYLKPIKVTVNNPSAHMAIGAALMPKLDLMPANDNATIANGRT
jgi:hypothetical protein